MTTDLFGEWRRAADAGEIKHYDVVFKRFEPWIIRNGFDAADLSPQAFDAFLSYLVLTSVDGMAAGVRAYERTLRSYYRWALERQLVARLPFPEKADIRPVRRPAKITTAEVLEVWESAVKRAMNSEIREGWRESAARSALAIGLIYHFAYVPTELSELTHAGLEKVFAKFPNAARAITPSAILYFDLVGAERRSATQVFVAPITDGHRFVRQFTKEIKEIAALSDVVAPWRFSVEEIRRRHKVDFARDRATARLSLSNIDPKSIRLAGRWSAEEVIQLLRLHPRGVARP